MKKKEEGQPAATVLLQILPCPDAIHASLKILQTPTPSPSPDTSKFERLTKSIGQDPRVFVSCIMELNMRVAKEKIDLLLELLNLDDGLLNNETSNLTVVNDDNLDFDFLQARTLIKEVETGLNIL